MPTLCNGPGHHVTGKIPGVAADAAGARGRRAVVVLMIYLLPAPAHFEVNALSGRLTSPVPCARDMARTPIALDTLRDPGRISWIVKPASASRPRLRPRGRAQRHRPRGGCFEARPRRAVSAPRTPAH